jgi:hypothetical protein
MTVMRRQGTAKRRRVTVIAPARVPTRMPGRTLPMTVPSHRVHRAYDPRRAPLIVSRSPNGGKTQTAWLGGVDRTFSGVAAATPSGSGRGGTVLRLPARAALRTPCGARCDREVGRSWWFHTAPNCSPIEAGVDDVRPSMRGQRLVRNTFAGNADAHARRRDGRGDRARHRVHRAYDPRRAPQLVAHAVSLRFRFVAVSERGRRRRRHAAGDWAASGTITCSDSAELTCSRANGATTT